MRILSAAAIGLLGFIACSPSLAGSAEVKVSAKAPLHTKAHAAPARVAAPDAVFVRDDPAQAIMTLDRESAGWRVAFRAGGLPNGPATAADCEVQAVGLQDAEDVIAARVVPFEGELNEITAADIGTDAPVIQVSVGPEGVFVQDGGAAARFCGMGSDIDGFYRRTGSPE
jgi:UDP:flavonoid glycosyltransferase YjiC (YdhE family)